jgi:hypothetical protein
MMTKLTTTMMMIKTNRSCEYIDDESSLDKEEEGENRRLIDYDDNNDDMSYNETCK